MADEPTSEFGATVPPSPSRQLLRSVTDIRLTSLSTAATLLPAKEDMRYPEHVTALLDRQGWVDDTGDPCEFLSVGSISCGLWYSGANRCRGAAAAYLDPD